MKRTSILLLLLLVSRLAVQAVEEPFGKGRIIVRQVAHNAVRIQYKEGADVHDSLPDWLYVRHEETSGDNIRVSPLPRLPTSTSTAWGSFRTAMPTCGAFSGG